LVELERLATNASKMASAAPVLEGAVVPCDTEEEESR
jgi:hypothetical protein